MIPCNVDDNNSLPLMIDNNVVDFFVDTDSNSNPTFIHMSTINNPCKTEFQMKLKEITVHRKVLKSR